MSLPISSENPNVACGSNGCLCYPSGGDETKGPFIIFTPTETDNISAPHAVLCAHCAIDAASEVYENDAAESEAAEEIVYEDDEIIEEDVDEALDAVATEPPKVTI